jgi:hypothetical protein
MKCADTVILLRQIVREEFDGLRGRPLRDAENLDNLIEKLT